MCLGGPKSLKLSDNLERAKGFEPSTPTLARLCSTPELHPRSRRDPRRQGASCATIRRGFQGGFGRWLRKSEHGSKHAIRDLDQLSHVNAPDFLWSLTYGEAFLPQDVSSSTPLAVDAGRGAFSWLRMTERFSRPGQATGRTSSALMQQRGLKLCGATPRTTSIRETVRASRHARRSFRVSRSSWRPERNGRACARVHGR